MSQNITGRPSGPEDCSPFNNLPVEIIEDIIARVEYTPETLSLLSQVDRRFRAIINVNERYLAQAIASQHFATAAALSPKFASKPSFSLLPELYERSHTISQILGNSAFTRCCAFFNHGPKAYASLAHVQRPLEVGLHLLHYVQEPLTLESQTRLIQMQEACPKMSWPQLPTGMELHPALCSRLAKLRSLPTKSQALLFVVSFLSTKAALLLSGVPTVNGRPSVDMDVGTGVELAFQETLFTRGPDYLLSVLRNDVPIWHNLPRRSSEAGRSAHRLRIEFKQDFANRVGCDPCEVMRKAWELVDWNLSEQKLADLLGTSSGAQQRRCNGSGKENVGRLSGCTGCAKTTHMT